MKWQKDDVGLKCNYLYSFGYRNYYARAMGKAYLNNNWMYYVCNRDMTIQRKCCRIRTQLMTLRGAGGEQRSSRGECCRER